MELTDSRFFRFFRFDTKSAHRFHPHWTIDWLSPVTIIPSSVNNICSWTGCAGNSSKKFQTVDARNGQRRIIRRVSKEGTWGVFQLIFSLDGRFPPIKASNGSEAWDMRLALNEILRRLELQGRIQGCFPSVDLLDFTARVALHWRLIYGKDIMAILSTGTEKLKQWSYSCLLC